MRSAPLCVPPFSIFAKWNHAVVANRKTQRVPAFRPPTDDVSQERYKLAFGRIRTAYVILNTAAEEGIEESFTALFPVNVDLILGFTYARSIARVRISKDTFVSWINTAHPGFMAPYLASYPRVIINLELDPESGMRTGKWWRISNQPWGFPGQPGVNVKERRLDIEEFVLVFHEAGYTMWSTTDEEVDEYAFSPPSGVLGVLAPLFDWYTPDMKTKFVLVDMPDIPLPLLRRNLTSSTSQTARAYISSHLREVEYITSETYISRIGRDEWYRQTIAPLPLEPQFVDEFQRWSWDSTHHTMRRQ